ncbi:MAG: UvrD-helicase domain-containing protein [Erysipelotrichaceae bacterium]|uniref:ATP-dependent helicase n=1 Tax=Floccifex sp. TaxID=2815810 RepID=UPI002A757EF3|nr:UvrD-helicase domain-containing protein [Floccifex sp.]MDD7280816.1 UvrD-helicase domain-containing protein [Erysipelotrichaceae bacterium]MDY2957964.1 UvrD-helicase domain-containing protein [Floccifex sp.]
MEILNSLNTNQKEAATTINQHVRIIAGAGSGKTRVLMARIVYLIQQCGVWPNRILAITFTNKATNEMKERLHAQLGDDATSVRISTIHSLCVRILREDPQAIDYPKSFTILDGDDQKAILRPIYKKMDIQLKALPYGKVLGAISSYKCGQVSCQMAMELAMSDEQETIARIYRDYEAARQEMKALDFDDLLLQARYVLKTNEQVRTKWQNRLDYIHVDEFQDVDEIQYEIIRYLTGKNTILCVVGDPDQTIYTWRGASVDIIMRFDKDFPTCKTVILDQNYRSIQPILDASNALIRNNENRIKKELYSTIDGNQKIVMHQSVDDNEEPLYISRQIVELKRKGVEFKDIAILYRSNYSSRAFERILRKVGIPYTIYGGIRFYERQEIKDMLSYLKLCTLPDENDPKQMSLNLAVLRVINCPRRGIGAKTIETLTQQATDKNIYEVMKNPQDVSKAVSQKCKQFVDLIEEIRSHRNDYSLEDYFQYVLETSGYLQMLSDENEEDRIENLKELKQDIAQSVQENPNLTLEEYLQDVALFTDKSQEEKMNSVSLMTVHAAKGLEFENVFIVNFNEGVFPSSRAIDEGGNKSLEEERRLCYVAMTRAKKYLCISWNRGYSYLLESYKTPSRFVKEIPSQYIEQEQAEQKPITVQANKPMPKQKTRYRKGDLVEHAVYGQGVIIKLDGNIATIAFKQTFGTKKLNALHPSLKKL